MNCEHRECTKIYTYVGIDMEIVDTNYQCNKCAKILNKEQYQDIITGFCSNCNGSGEHTDGYDFYKCGCILNDE